MQNKNSRRGQTQLVLKNNPVNIPELVSGSSTQAVTQPSPQRQALKMPKQVRQYSYLTRACGFTLIELLVVVLIIGILAAVALPQYKVAVGKARLSQLISTVKTVVRSEELFYTTYGKYTNDWNSLDISFAGTVDSKSHSLTQDDGLLLSLTLGSNTSPASVSASDTKLPGITIMHSFAHSGLSTDWNNNMYCYAAKNNIQAQKLCMNATNKYSYNDSGASYRYTF